MPDRDTDKATRLLEGAYAISTAADSVEYYREFAALYDDEYADRMGYIYPSMLANVYQHHATDKDTPIADIGCGTGLVAQALQLLNNTATIDGIDISQEMLDSAGTKLLYRALYQTDLTREIKQLPGRYGAIVSAGTFTFGHLGPEILQDLTRLGRAGTLYCIGVNSIYFKEQNFPQTLDRMIASGLIDKPVIEVKPIYDQHQKTNNNHATDTASVLVYRQLKMPEIL